MIKVVITGPESTGKTTIAKELCDHFEGLLIHEYAREYIDNLDRDYTVEDITEIAIEQVDRDNKGTSQYPELMVCDTDLLTLKIWSEFKYGELDEWIPKSLDLLLPDFYLLMATDIPWEADPQRENPNDREELFNIYKKEIEALNVPYAIIKGTGNERLQNAIKEIEKIYIP